MLHFLSERFTVFLRSSTHSNARQPLRAICGSVPRWSPLRHAVTRWDPAARIPITGRHRSAKTLSAHVTERAVVTQKQTGCELAHIWLFQR